MKYSIVPSPTLLRLPRLTKSKALRARRFLSTMTEMTTSTPKIAPSTIAESLTAFVQNGLQTILAAKTPSAFDEAVNELFSPQVNITVNGAHVSRARYTQLYRTLKTTPRGDANRSDDSRGILSGQDFQNLKFMGSVEPTKTNVPGVTVRNHSVLLHTS